MSGAFPVVHGRRQRRPHLRFHHGGGPAGFLLPHVLVRTQRCQPERGRAGGLHGESNRKKKKNLTVEPQRQAVVTSPLCLSAPLPEMFGRAPAQPGLLPADTAGRLGRSPGQEGRAESAGQL